MGPVEHVRLLDPDRGQRGDVEEPAVVETVVAILPMGQAEGLGLEEVGEGQRLRPRTGRELVLEVAQDRLLPVRTADTQRSHSPSRLGPMGDAPKAQCVTCHNGVYKPLYGLQMAKHYPALWGGHTDRTTPPPAPEPAMTTAQGLGSSFICTNY